MLQLGCKLNNTANICLHKSTDAQISLFTELHETLLQRITKKLVAGPSAVLWLEAVADEIFSWESPYKCQSKIGVDAGELCPYAMCQPMLRGIYGSSYED